MRNTNRFDTLSQFTDPNYNEHDAFIRYKNGEVSLDYIVANNYKLCFDYINKYFLDINSLTYDDKVSIATQGLIEAIKSFKPEKGCTLSTFAYQVIFFRFTRELRNLKKRNKVKTISMDTQINDTTNSNNRLKLSLEAKLVDYDTNVSKQVENNIMLNKVKGLMRELNPVARDVMEMRYIQGKSQLEVAAIRGVTQSNIAQIEKRAINRIRKQLVV